MSHEPIELYQPIDTLQPVDENVWIVGRTKLVRIFVGWKILNDTNS
jgi:hypothetical protein